VHDAERVLEAGVHGTRIDVIRPGQLADSAQALRSQLIYNRPLPVVDFNERVDRASNLVPYLRWEAYISTTLAN